MAMLTKRSLDVQEAGPPATDGPHIPEAVQDELGADYTPPRKVEALDRSNMVEVGVGPGGKEQPIGRAVPVAWLLYQLSIRVAKGEWAIRMVADKEGGIWIEGNSWNNDWPKIGTDP